VIRLQKFKIFKIKIDICNIEFSLDMIPKQN
jgi:hypothetical protein